MRKDLYMSASALILLPILSSCSAKTDSASHPIAVIVFILLFIGASVCSAAITYKIKTKNSFRNSDTEDNMENNNGS